MLRFLNIGAVQKCANRVESDFEKCCKMNTSTPRTNQLRHSRERPLQNYLLIVSSNILMHGSNILRSFFVNPQQPPRSADSSAGSTAPSSKQGNMSGIIFSFYRGSPSVLPIHRAVEEIYPVLFFADRNLEVANFSFLLS